MSASEVSHGPKILLFEVPFAFAHLLFDSALYRLTGMAIAPAALKV